MVVICGTGMLWILLSSLGARSRGKVLHLLLLIKLVHSGGHFSRSCELCCRGCGVAKHFHARLDSLSSCSSSSLLLLQLVLCGQKEVLLLLVHRCPAVAVLAVKHPCQLLRRRGLGGGADHLARETGGRVGTGVVHAAAVRALLALSALLGRLRALQEVHPGPT